MINGEAISSQRSAEDDAKQRNAVEQHKLAQVGKATEKERDMESNECIKIVQRRSMNVPVKLLEEIRSPKGSVELAPFLRTSFELC